MDIQTLRKMRGNDFSKITGEFEKISNPKSGGDDRFWKLEADKAGNATATIRFLPRAEGDELPWVRIYSHGFQGPTGKWYIENSLTTIGKDDPVSEANSALWASGSEANKEIARKQKRRLSYIANVLIVSDPKNPQNEGQVRLFRFGKKIFDKIMDKARPTFEDETPVNVFDLWEGANFKLRMRKKDGYSNYDESVFMEPSEITSDEDELLRIVNGQHKLSEFIDPKNFKSYAELKAKFEAVMSADSYTGTAAQMSEDDAPAWKEPEEKRSLPPKEPKVSKPAVVSDNSGDDDDDDVMSYFAKIAEED